MAIDERRGMDISNIEKIILKLLREKPKIDKDDLLRNVAFQYGEKTGESMSSLDYNIAIKTVSKKTKKSRLLNYTI